MAKKKFNMSKEKVFQIINTVIVVGIITFYLGRLIYYKKKFDTIYQSASYSYLATVLVDRIDYTASDRLIENEDGTYTYVGNVNNNYISLSGNLYRIMSIDENKNIKIIAENAITVLPLFEKEVFYNTSVSAWLNRTEEENTGIYEKIIRNSSLLAGNNSCVCSLDDFEKHTCNESLDSNRFSLLSLKEYLVAGGQNSYLNNGESFWTGNRNSEGKYYFVNEEGALGVSYSESLVFGVRPVLTLDGSTIARSGDGTLEKPFELYGIVVEKALDAPIGSYIMYGDLKWRVESIDENRNVILIMDKVIQEDGQDYALKFGNYNDFDPKSGLGYYLNNQFIEQLDNYQEYLVLKNWTYGTFPYLGEYDYKVSCFEEEVQCYVFIPNISYKHLTGNENFYISNNGLQLEKLVCVINENLIKYVNIKEKANVKPVICLSGQILITSGSGAEDDPFILEVISND